MVTRRIIKLLGVSALALAALPILLDLGARYRLGQLEGHGDAPCAGDLWAHRGLHRGAPERENTLAAAQEAFDAGFTGIELDVFFEAGTFVVDHDDSNSPDAPHLDAFFAALGPNVYYWLDLKNLTAENVNELANALRALAQRYAVFDRLWVESSNPRLLDRLRRTAETRVLYTVRYPTRLSGALVRASYRWRVAWYGFPHLSIVETDFTPTFRSDFARNSVFAYTVNSAERLTALQALDACVILTDAQDLQPKT